MNVDARSVEPDMILDWASAIVSTVLVLTAAYHALRALVGIARACKARARVANGEKQKQTLARSLHAEMRAALARDDLDETVAICRSSRFLERSERLGASDANTLVSGILQGTRALSGARASELAVFECCLRAKTAAHAFVLALVLDAAHMAPGSDLSRARRSDVQHLVQMTWAQCQTDCSQLTLGADQIADLSAAAQYAARVFRPK